MLVPVPSNTQQVVLHRLSTQSSCPESGRCSGISTGSTQTRSANTVTMFEIRQVFWYQHLATHNTFGLHRHHVPNQAAVVVPVTSNSQQVVLHRLSTQSICSETGRCSGTSTSQHTTRSANNVIMFENWQVFWYQYTETHNRLCCIG